MNDFKTELVCPLGAKCRETKNNTNYQCSWLVNVQGKHPQSDEIVNEWRCSMAWLPILLVENAQTNRGQTQAIESLRNEMVTGQQQFTQLMRGAMKQQALTKE